MKLYVLDELITHIFIYCYSYVAIFSDLALLYGNLFVAHANTNLKQRVYYNSTLFASSNILKLVTTSKYWDIDTDEF